MPESVAEIKTSEAGEPPQWATTTRYIAGLGLIILGIIGLLLLLPIIQVLFIAFVISYLMYLPSRALNQRLGIAFPLAVILLYGIAVIVLVLLILIGIPALLREINNLLITLGDAWALFLAALEGYQPGDLVLSLGTFQFDFDPLIQPIRNFVLPAPADVNEPLAISAINLRALLEGVVNVAGGAVYVVTSVVGTLAGFIAALFLAFVISLLTLLDLNRSRGFLIQWLPKAYSREISILVTKIDRVWVSFFRGQLIVGSLLGIISFIQFTLMGVPGALPLAIQNGIISLIPNIGGLISAIPVVIVTLLSGSTVFTEMPNVTFTLLVVFIIILYSQVIYTFVSPVIVGKSVNLPVVFVIVGVVIGFALGGILGALLIVPIMSSLRLVVSYVMAKIALHDPFPGEDVDPSAPHGFISQIVRGEAELALVELEPAAELAGG